MTTLTTSLLALALTTQLRAETPACQDLEPEEQVRVSALMDATFIHDCCDQALSACLEQQPRCLLAERLAENICRRVVEGQEDDTIRRALKGRAWTMLPYGDPVDLDLSDAPTAGEPGAPVKVVVFSAPRGYHCARVVPGVHEAVTSGSLQGKVELSYRLFPLRSNEHYKEAGLAFLAAQRLGAFWDFALHSYANFDAFSLDTQLLWAAQLGLDRAVLERLMGEPDLLDQLKASKRQGVENGVSSTPTFFIDGHLYRGELEVDEIVDTLEEAWERSQGLSHVGDES